MVSNYRPVSLSFGVSKIMERVIFKHVVYNYFHSSNSFYRYQAGFLPGYSIVRNVHHNVVQNIDKGKSCCMGFCDLSKAFDRVWHKEVFFKAV